MKTADNNKQLQRKICRLAHQTEETVILDLVYQILLQSRETSAAEEPEIA